MNFLIEAVALLGEGLTSILPKSPFSALELAFDSDLLRHVNYYVPIKECVDIAVAWGAAILIWYAWQIVLRWVKAIQ